MLLWITDTVSCWDTEQAPAVAVDNIKRDSQSIANTGIDNKVYRVYCYGAVVNCYRPRVKGEPDPKQATDSIKPTDNATGDQISTMTTEGRDGWQTKGAGVQHLRERDQ